MSQNENSLDDARQLLEMPWLFAERMESKPASTLKRQLKCIYDRLKLLEYTESGQKFGSTLPELIVQNLDEEQIWQQIELQNEFSSRRVNKLIGKLPISSQPSIFERVKSKSREKSAESSQTNPQHANLREKISEGVDDPASAADSDEDQVDDLRGTEKIDFFSRQEMEDFLDAEDRKEMGEGKNNADDDFDMLEDEEDSEDDIDGSKNYRYSDFFGANNKSHKLAKKVKFNVQGSDGEENDEINDKAESTDEGLGQSDEMNSNSDVAELKSSFEIRQEKLQQKIETLEQKNVADKPWQQSGEVWAKNRPENSLLEEFVEFEHTTKLPPIITEQTTKSLEDVIRQRIKDKTYDDVERKIKPISEPQRYKNDLVLDQQKSKLSLSQIYEQEYLKQHKVDREEEKNEQHEIIRRMMKDLFIKLDALTNYHYTPKLPSTEIKIVTNTKTISVEEVAPVATTDADMLAPEEVKKKSRSIVKSTDERTKTDKLRDLRHKKKLATLKAKRNEEKEKKTKVPKDKLKMLQKLGKIHKVKIDPKSAASKSSSSRKGRKKRRQMEKSRKL